MRAIYKEFRVTDYPKKETTGWLKEQKYDWEEYRNAISTFLTELGPERIISVFAPAGWYRWGGWATAVWYWKAESRTSGEK